METQHTKPPAYEDFARQVRAWRGKSSQAVAAAELGLSLSGYCNWEQGRRMPRGHALKLVLERLERRPCPQPLLPPVKQEAPAFYECLSCRKEITTPDEIKSGMCARCSEEIQAAGSIHDL